MAVGALTLLVTLGIDAAIGLVCGILFSIFRIVGPTRAYYNPRWYYRQRPGAPAASGHSAGQPGTTSGGQRHHSQQQQQQQLTSSSNSSSSRAPASHEHDEAAAGTVAVEGDVAANSASVFEAGMNDETGLGGVPPSWAPLPPRLPAGLLTWIWPLLRMSEAHLIASAGLDVAMLLRFIRFALTLLLVLSVWCIGVVLPVNFTGNNLFQVASDMVPDSVPQATTPSSQPNSFLIPTLPPGLGGATAASPRNTSGAARNRSSSGSSGGGGQRVQLGPGQDVGSLAEDITSGRYIASNLDRFSLANIPAGSPLLWVHLASVFVVTAVTLALLWRATSSALRLYLAHLSSPAAVTAGSTHTALLRDIPGVSRGTLLEQVLHNWLFGLLPGPLKRRLREEWRLRYAAGGSSKASKASLPGQHQHQQQQVRRTWFGCRKQQGANGSHPPQGPQEQQLEQEQQSQLKQHATSTPAAPAKQSAGTEQQLASELDRGAGAQWGSPAHSSSSSSSDSNVGSGSAEEQAVHENDAGQQRDQVTIVIPSAADFAAGYTTADSTRSRKQHSQHPQALVAASSSSSPLGETGHHHQPHGANLGSPHQQQHHLQGAASGMPAAGVLSEHQQRVLYGEWRRAATALADGMSLQDFVYREFAAVYGAHNIVSVRLVSRSSHTDKLVQQYNATRSALQDLLDHYATQLQHHAAASAAASRAGPQQDSVPERVLQGAATPFRAAGRVLGLVPGKLPHPVVAPAAATTVTAASTASSGAGGGGRGHGAAGSGMHAGGAAGGHVVSRHHPLHTRRGKLKPIKIIQLPLPDPNASQPPKLTTAAAAAATTTAAAAADASASVHDNTNGSSSSSSGADKLGHNAADSVSMMVDNSSPPVDMGAQRDAADLWPVDLLAIQSKDHQQQAGGAHPQHGSSSRSTNTIAESKEHSNSSTGSAPGCCGRSRAKADALDVLLMRLGILRAELVEAQAEADRQPYPAALITFRTRTALATAAGTHHVAESAAWQVRAAPPPDSLLWTQLGLRAWQVGARRAAVKVVLLAVAFFYVIPVGAVQGLLQLEKLQRAPVIGTLMSLPVVHSLLVGVLPGLALRIFVLLLPVLLYALNRRAGAVGQADMDGHVATQFFTLSVVTVFFGSFITGSLLNQLALLLTNPQQVLTILGTGVPQTANFFILYILFGAFVGRSWMLLRPWGLLMTSFRLLGARKAGRRGRRRAVLVGTYRMFGPTVPEHSMILLLSVVFCVIAPLVLLAGLAFFSMTLVIESYNWCMVFRRPYEGGGVLWQQVFRHVMITLYLFQLVMIALLIVKRFVWVVLLLIPLVVTIIMHRIGSRSLQRSWGVMSMRAAYELDVADADAAAAAAGGASPAETGATGSSTQAHEGSQHSSRVPGVQGDTVAGAEQPPSTGSVAAAWSELYRPPGERLLLSGHRIEAELAQQVQAMKLRLAAHNSEAASPNAAVKSRGGVV